MVEQWSKIPNFDYSVSNYGNVRNDKTNRIKEKHIDRYGYDIVHLYKNGIRFNKRVHRLVAEAFVNNPENKACVNHIDGDKLNNSADNLEWVTYSENMKHAYRTGLAKPHPTYGMRGKRNPNGGRKGKPIICTTTNQTFESIIEASNVLDIPQSSIWDCVKGLRPLTHGLHFEYL